MAERMEFQTKVAVVTGGATGIGRAGVSRTEKLAGDPATMT
jgi:NAD(P)-dependent dehydrogenase (short-subunit alcohol dehydrogenase family)